MSTLPPNFKLGYGLILIDCPKCPGITQITYVGEGAGYQGYCAKCFKNHCDDHLENPRCCDREYCIDCMSNILTSCKTCNRQVCIDYCSENCVSQHVNAAKK